MSVEARELAGAENVVEVGYVGGGGWHYESSCWQKR